MEIPDDVFEAILEQMRQVQITLRNLRSDFGKWKRQMPFQPAISVPAEVQTIKPPTEKQILFLKSLGVEDIPATRIEAWELLQELNEKRENGEYSIPPTAKQLKFLKALKYAGPVPESKEEAWRLLQELTAIE